MIARPFDGPLKSIYFRIRHNMKIVDLHISPWKLLLYCFTDVQNIFFFLITCAIDIMNREK